MYLCRFPSLRSFKYMRNQFIKGLKICIGCFFITHRSPKYFLAIEFRMVCRNIMNGEFLVRFKKIINTFTLMPTGPINPKMNPFFWKHMPDVRQRRQESICVAFRASNHTMTAMKRIDPTKNIQTLLVLTAGQHKRLVVFPFLRPHPTQFRVKTETGLVLKYDDLVACPFQNGLEFFLTL